MVIFDALFVILLYWIAQYCKMFLLFRPPPACARQMKTIIDKILLDKLMKCVNTATRRQERPTVKRMFVTLHSSLQHFMTAVKYDNCQIYLHKLTEVMFCNLSVSDKYK